MKRAVPLLLAVAAFLVPAHSTTAVAPSEYGWWWKGNSRQLPVAAPAPPVVPNDGIYVAKEVESAAEAAFNFLAPDGVAATLELKVVPGSLTGVPIIAACPLTAAFFGEQAGVWENRPVPNCDLALTTGELLGDGSAVVFNLPDEFQVFPEFWNFSLLADSQAAPFQVAFEAPAESSFVVKPRSQFSDQTPPPFFEPPPPSFPDVPPPPLPGPVPVAPVVTEPPAAASSPRPTATPREGIRRAAAPTEVDDSFPRLMAGLILAGMFGALGAVGWRGRRAAAAAGADAEAVGGLGRFARTRSGPPRGLL